MRHFNASVQNNKAMIWKGYGTDKKGKQRKWGVETLKRSVPAKGDLKEEDSSQVGSTSV